MDTFGEARARVSAREAAERYGLEPNRAGFVRCPFHGSDSTPSLKLYDGDRGWHCFGCGAGGDVIDLTAKLFGISLRQAVIRLNADFGLGLSLDGARPQPVFSQAARERARKERELQAYRAEYTAKCREVYELRHLPLPCPQSPLWGEYAAVQGRLEYLEYWFAENAWR